MQILAAIAERFDKAHDFALEPHIEAVIQCGAHAYGTQTPSSDIDLTIVITPPAKHVIGFGSFEQAILRSSR